MEQLPSRTTLCSTADEPAPARSWRSGERYMTLFRVASLTVDDRRDLCVVKNISSGGALIRAYCDLREGQLVRLEIKEQQPIEAEVAWIKGTDTGIDFNSPIDILGLLKGGSEGPRPRMPRMEVRAVGFVRQDALLHRVTINNISQGGISARCGAELNVGGQATVTVAGLAPMQAVVRWGGSGGYGITFNSVLGLPLLVEWLHTQTSTGRA